MMKLNFGYIDLGGGQVYYEAAGEGIPLVFLHAAFTDSRMWDSQWHSFGMGHRVIRYDMLGSGRSAPLEGAVSRRQELYRMLEANKVGQAVLVGCSLGGEIILDAALDRPELVSGLVLVSTVPAGFEMQGEPPEDLIDMLAALEQGDLARASELQVRLGVDGPFRRPDQVDVGVRQRAVEMHLGALAKGSWSYMLEPVPDPLDPPAARRLDQISIPTLVIAGELDDPEILRAADVMAEALPGAQKVILRNAAHLPNMEQPDEFNRVVMSFLQGFESVIEESISSQGGQIGFSGSKK